MARQTGTFTEEIAEMLDFYKRAADRADMTADQGSNYGSRTERPSQIRRLIRTPAVRGALRNRSRGTRRVDQT